MPSNSSCSAMKFGPLTFQWACLVCVWRSMQSASRALSSSTTLTRVASGMSFFVLYIARLLIHVLENRWLTPHYLTGKLAHELSFRFPDAPVENKRSDPLARNTHSDSNHG